MAWISWNKVLASNKYGGLGVSSLYALNRALLFNGFGDFFSHGSCLWMRFVKDIYGEDGALNSSSSLSKCSPWLDIIHEVTVLRTKDINLLDLILKKVGNGLNTLLWDDPWLDDLAGGAEEEQLGFLLSHMDGLILKNILDRWVWSLEATCEFSVKFVHQLIDDSILSKEEVVTRWVKVMFIKINVFAWRVRLDKLPTRLNHSLKGIDISTIVCRICDASVESSSHIFSSCPMARQLRRKLMCWLPKQMKEILEVVSYVKWWLIWRFRN
nr:RNA-directed DNA polymerase, eukaryota, reverse transcriptase zinc-binding domain protein [Tanacetum cinerariifolium]